MIGGVNPNVVGLPLIRPAAAAGIAAANAINTGLPLTGLNTGLPTSANVNGIPTNPIVTPPLVPQGVNLPTAANLNGVAIGGNINGYPIL